MAAGGAGAGSSATAQALLGFADIIVLTLNNASVAGITPPEADSGGALGALQAAAASAIPAAAPATSPEGGTRTSPASASLSALAALQSLAAGGDAAPAPDGAASAGSSGGSCAGRPQGAQPGVPQEKGRLRIARTREWLEGSVGRVVPLMSQALPPLATHPRAAVREALATGVWLWLCVCARALPSPVCGLWVML